jgi:hypothetical protein
MGLAKIVFQQDEAQKIMDGILKVETLIKLPELQ